MVAVCAVSLTACAAVASPPGTERLQTLLTQLRSDTAVWAIAEVVNEDGVWRGGSGVAELGASLPVPVDGHFRIGSITKTFVSVVVLQLVSEARIGLDDPVERWLPGVVPGAPLITVRQLLANTSGLYDYVETLPFPPRPGFFENRWRTWSPGELLGRAFTHPPDFPPGSAYGYSNTGYALLGMLIERITARAYATEIYDRIIRPLSLPGTSVPGPAVSIPEPHPRGYVPAAQGLADFTEMNPTVFGAGGEMISTTADLNRFFDALLGGRMVPARLLDDMRTPGVEGSTYGLGLRMRTTSCGIRVFGNDGDALASAAWSFSSEDLDRQTTIALGPAFTGDPDEAVDAFLDHTFCGM
ncbi:serine hydrolase domain-containing protein [Nocardia sp. NPDC003345]